MIDYKHRIPQRTLHDMLADNIDMIVTLALVLGLIVGLTVGNL